MPFADPVMDADQPCLEICEDEMDDGQKLVGHSFRLSRAVPGLRWRTSTAQATRTLWCTPRPSPRVRPPIQVSSTSRVRSRDPRCDPGAGGPFRREAYGGSGRLSHSALARVAVETGRPTCPESGWRPGRRPRTKWTMACDCAPSPCRQSILSDVDSCGMPAHQGGSRCETAHQ